MSGLKDTLACFAPGIFIILLFISGLRIPLRNVPENAKYSLKMCQIEEFKKPIVVTSAYHPKRSFLNFKKLESV
jgi:hypothetical protein